MSLVRNKKVIEFFKKKGYNLKQKCSCISEAGVKHCRVNCDNTSFNKIHYDN